MKKTIIAIMLVVFMACNSSSPEQAPTEIKEATADAAAPAMPKVLPDAETQVIKDGVKAYADGNLDAFLAQMDDNVKIYYPGPGDSLVGKEAIKAFFKTRADSVVSAEAMNPTYLAVDVPAGRSAQEGKWLMAWYTWNIKYKNGKTAVFPIQVTQHLNAAGKIDMGIWYYDMARAFANPPKPVTSK